MPSDEGPFLFRCQPRSMNYISANARGWHQSQWLKKVTRLKSGMDATPSSKWSHLFAPRANRTGEPIPQCFIFLLLKPLQPIGRSGGLAEMRPSGTLYTTWRFSGPKCPKLIVRPQSDIQPKPSFSFFAFGVYIVLIYLTVFARPQTRLGMRNRALTWGLLQQATSTRYFF